MRSDPGDPNVLMRIGDLHLKRGAAAKAAEVYVTVSRYFAQAGFEAKAVAVAKQVLRIDPDRLEIRVELGELYQRMGLSSDAVREYQSALEMYRERGATTEVYDLLKRAASLDPENISNRLSLAGLMLREGLEEEARAGFDRLLADSEAADADDAVERVATAILEHFPDHADALRKLGEVKLKAGAAEEAATLLGAAAEGLPGDLEVRKALADALETVGDDEQAQRVWSEVAGLYRERGDEETARDILQRRVSIATLGAPTKLMQEIERQAGESQPEMAPDLENPDRPGPLEKLSIDAEPESEANSGLELELDLELDQPDPAGTPAARSPAPPQFASTLQVDPLEPDSESETSGSMLLDDIVSGEQATDPVLPAAEPNAGGAQDPGTLLAEARVALEYEQFELAASRARSVLQHEPASDAARGILSQVLSLQGDARGAIALEHERRLQARAEGNAARVAEIDQRIEALEQPDPDVPIPEIELQDGPGTETVVSLNGPGPESVDVADRSELPLVEAFEILESEADSQAGDEDELVLITPIDAADDSESDATPTRASTGSGIDAIFAAFKQGIQAQLSDDESGAHYDLAIAYREMGLLDDAVQELEVARRGETCRLEALSLLATCKVELGRPAEAIDHLEEALALAKEDPSALTALRYELGGSLRACGRHREALVAFRSVAQADAGFRDVALRLRELETLDI